MLDKLFGLMAGYVLCKLMSDFSLDSLFHGTGPAQAPPPTPGAAPVNYSIPKGSTPAHIPPGAIPVASPGAVPSSKNTVPKGLPPFPGPGWRAFTEAGQYVSQRAWQLLPLLKLGEFVVEPAPGDPSRWLSYKKEPHGGGKTGVTAYTPRAPTVAPSSAPYVAPTYVSTSAPSSSSAPSMIRRGSSGPDVVRWQKIVGVTPDGKFGPQTEAATRMWQGKRGLKPDGIVGPITWAKALGVTT